jgi:hypothetical protein
MPNALSEPSEILEKKSSIAGPNRTKKYKPSNGQANGASAVKNLAVSCDGRVKNAPHGSRRILANSDVRREESS